MTTLPRSLPKSSLPARETPIDLKEFLAKEQTPLAADFYWSMNIGTTVHKRTGEEIQTESLDHFLSRKAWEESFVDLVRQVSSEIHRKNLRGPAQFMIVHSDMLKVIASMESFKPDNKPEIIPQFALPTTKVGIFDNRFTVLVNNSLPSYRFMLCSLGEGLSFTFDVQGRKTPEVLVEVTSDPRFYKDELSYWVFVNVLGVEVK